MTEIVEMKNLRASDLVTKSVELSMHVKLFSFKNVCFVGVCISTVKALAKN